MGGIPRVILVTGRPGCGKTTLVREILPDLAGLHPAGFYTEEIREGGSRVGFRVVSLDGRTFLLAHERFPPAFRVGKYGVDIASFDAYLATVPFGEAKIAVIDEIGKMECLSARFCELVDGIFSSGRHAIATIAQKGTPFIESLKGREGVKVYTLGQGNRADIMDRIREWVSYLKGGGR
ncbi:MAG: nucleoside-triphosphatase [Methanolinea sp.]|nr:nucleoside-triphosphatase [Methanolinea sp.]